MCAIFISTVLLYSQTGDRTSDVKNNTKDRTSDVKKPNSTTTTTTQRSMSQTDIEKMKKKEKFEKLKTEKKSLLTKIKSLNNNIKKLDKDIQLVTDNLIKSLKEKDIETLKDKKSDMQLKKSETTNELVSLNKRVISIDNELNQKDDGYVLADGTLNWNKTFDIKKYEKNQFGTWSISVIAKDDMNNTSKEESINIKIDPKSDIPLLNIINPKPNARVPGNLMVVGTALDDDGIGRVELFLNNEKKPRICVGTDFWYYDLDTSGMKDGIHNLKLRTFDINGLSSKEYNVSFNLDRRMPSVTVDSMISGAIVSGTMNIKGKAIDDNGITKIEYSIDDRYSFLPILNKRDLSKSATKVEYQVSIDTDKLIEGIQTIWFRAIDKTGSIGYFPLTVTVDHKTPTIEIQYPKDKSKIGNRFTLFGVAKDDVEMKHILLKIEGPGAYPKEHKVLMLPGNPYWSFNCQSDLPKLIDLSKLKDGPYKFTATAEDVAGNKKSTSITVVLDSELEKPTLNLTSVHKNDAFSSYLPLYGTVNDDDGVKEVIVNIFKDGKKEMVFSKIIPSPYSLSENIDISSLSEGKYRLELIPADFYIKGNPTNIDFWIDRSFPKFDTAFINKEWAGKTLKGTLDLPIKVIKFGDIKSVTYSIFETVRNNEIVKPKQLKVIQNINGVHTLENIKEDIFKDNPNNPQGLYVVKLTVKDSQNRVSYLNVPIVIDNKEPIITEIKIDQKVGMMKNEEIKISDNFIIKDAVVELTGQPKATLKAGDSKEFKLKTKTSDGKAFIDYKLNIVATDYANNEKKYSVSINFKETKNSEHTIKIYVNKNENSIYKDMPILFVDKDKNSIDNLNSFYIFAPNPYLNSSFKIDKKEDLTVDLINKVNGIFYTKIDQDIRKNLSFGSYEATISLEEDNSGDITKSEFKKITFENDSEDPYGKVIWPPSYIAFNEDISLYGTCNDDSGVVKVFYSIDLTTDSNYKEMSVTTYDKIQNDGVPILDPLMREKKQTLADFVEAYSVSLIDNGKYFKLDVPLKDMKEGEHKVFFKLIDGSGKETIIYSSLYVDKTNPELKIWVPNDKDILNGKITIRGESSDNYYLANTVFALNDGKVIADGRFIWDGLYDLYNLNDIDLESEVTKDLSVDIFAYDSAGNKTKVTKTLKFDIKSDKPIVYINSPSVPDQRFADFIELAGVALDDDGIEYVEYRIDDGFTKNLENGQLQTDDEYGWIEMELEKGKPNWSVSIDKNFLSSGRHKLEVRAYDIAGVRSDSKSMTFQLDKENPEIKLFSPPNGSYLEGERLITGKATDPNEIDSVEISTSNGWSFVNAEGKENWKYYLNSKSIPDGTLKFLIKARDSAGSESFSFAVYNIDNTPPEIDILLPKDGFLVNNVYKIVGRAKDNIGIDKVMVKISVGQDNIFKNSDDEGFILAEGKEAWECQIDVKDWMPYRTYHLVAKVYDLAGNFTERSLDFVVNPLSDVPVVELDQPQSNQHLTGEIIEFFGTAKDDDGIEAVFIKIDDEDEVKVEGTGVWRYVLPTAKLKSGPHKVVVVAQEKSQDGKPGKFSGPISRVFYLDDSGPVINVLSHINGAPMEHRPWLTGKTYYYEKDLELKIKRDIQLKKYNELKKKFRKTPEKIPNPENIEVKKYEITPILHKYLLENSIRTIHLTLDNGNTYSQNVGLVSDWMVRVQTQYLTDGEHTLQLKAQTLNGKESISYFKVVVDRNLPKVIIDKPFENSRHNDKLVVMGSADDNGKVTEVKILLKQFDKDLGKVPKFIEGLYLWAQGLGGPTVSGGFGLSFFDDVVRLEGLFGWTPTIANMRDTGVDIYDQNLFGPQWGWKFEKYEPRFYGFVTGGKLLAKVIDIPFEFFWGEDARNFSISMAIGAGFYWFSGFGGGTGELESYDVVKKSKVLAGFMYQVDLFKVERYGPLRKFAIYFENAFYFIASEIQSELTPQIGFGIRNSFF